MPAEFIVRHFGPGGCGAPAFWIGREVDETLLVFGVFALDGSKPEAGSLVLCGVCGERFVFNSELALWVERATVIESRRATT